MKHVLPLAAALALTTASASAQILFNPDFSSGTTPAGYTPVTSNGGTISYANGAMTSGDDSVNGLSAYITGVSPGPAGTSINTQLTFAFNYTANRGTGNQAEITLLNLDTPAANNAVLSFTESPFDFGANEIRFLVNSGIQYGGATSTGNGEIDLHPISAVSGLTLTLNITTTFSNVGDQFTITNTGTLYDDSDDLLLGNYDLTTTGAATYGGYDPANNPLTLQLGTTGVSTDAGFISPGANTTISDVLIQTVPEPSTYALMLGSGGLLLLAVRRRLGLPGVRA